MEIRAFRVLCVVAVLFPALALAQNAQLTTDKGFMSTAGFTESHDSSLGWATELDSTAGYDFNRHFNLSVGVPIYLVQPIAQTNGTQQVNNSYNALGDAFLNLNYKLAGALGYAGTVTATAPTGNTKNGISTGRATFGWNNHFEHEISRFTPFAEAGVANSNTTLDRIHGLGSGKHNLLNDYASLGGISRFSGGASIDLVHSLTFSADAYDEVPFGNQKIYSRLLPKGVAGGLVSQHKNPSHFELAAVTSGTASIADDNGFETTLSLDPTRRVEVAFSYQRSVHYALDTVAFSTTYRFGHIAKPESSK